MIHLQMYLRLTDRLFVVLYIESVKLQLHESNLCHEYFDIFYIENWSFILDLKIIMQTFLKIFKGQEKAY